MKPAGDIAQEVLAAYRSRLESPKAVATELGISTAEVLERARGSDLTLHAVTIDGAVWIYRPHRTAVSPSASRTND